MIPINPHVDDSQESLSPIHRLLTTKEVLERQEREKAVEKERQLFLAPTDFYEQREIEKLLNEESETKSLGLSRIFNYSII